MQYYVVDAFTDEIFRGNPAGVCVGCEGLSADMMQKIATENNLSETAFIQKSKDGYNLRWFTPGFEIDLCGHATLASAYVISHYVEPKIKEITFHTKSGELTVTVEYDQLEMEFPSRPGKQIELSRDEIELLELEPQEVYGSRDLMLVLSSEKEVLEYVPDYNKLRKLDRWLGVIITAKGDSEDFVSRYFCPEINLEDPVTGSSHCTLIPYWSARLNKRCMRSRQVSKRGGVLYCEDAGSKVKIAGKAVLFSKGEIIINGIC